MISRDPRNRVFVSEGRIYRALTREAASDWRAVSASAFWKTACASGDAVAGVEAARPAGAPEGDWALFLRHEKIRFVSHPYEWNFEMLRDAALLHLRLLERALADGFTMTDGSSSNVQWSGSRPVFTDAGSFVPYRGGPWAGYGEFCSSFLYPLLLTAHKRVPFGPWLRGAGGEIDGASLAPLFGGLDAFKPGVWTHLWLKTRLEKALGSSDRARSASGAVDAAMIRRNAARLSSLVSKLASRTPASAWEAYGAGLPPPYPAADFEKKKAFVGAACADSPGKLAWDLGAGSGVFARAAARHFETVVAFESDPAASQALYRALRAERSPNVLPLAVDVCEIESGAGFGGASRASLVSRGTPDLVLCLAFLHHAAFTRRIALRDFVEWLASLGARLVIEFVEPSDPWAASLGAPPAGYSRAAFEAALARRFAAARTLELCGGRRILYECRNLSKIS